MASVKVKAKGFSEEREGGREGEREGERGREGGRDTLSGKIVNRHCTKATALSSQVSPICHMSHWRSE